MRDFEKALEYVYIFQRRISLIKNENKKLQKKINEMKIINQAKILLVEKEPQNRWLEKIQRAIYNSGGSLSPG